MFFPSKRQVVSRRTSPPCIIDLVAKACHQELEGLLEFLHRRRNYHSLRVNERKSDTDAKEITPALERPSMTVVASSSSSLSSTGSRSG